VLFLTVSRHDDTGRTETLVAINDPVIVRRVLRDIAELSADGEKIRELPSIVRRPVRGKEGRHDGARDVSA